MEDRRYAVCVKTETAIHVMAYGCHWCIVQASHRQNNGVVEDERESAATNGSTELRTAVSASHGLIGVNSMRAADAGNVKSSLQHSTTSLLESSHYDGEVSCQYRTGPTCTNSREQLSGSAKRKFLTDSPRANGKTGTGAAQSRCHCLARQLGRSDVHSVVRARTRSHRYCSL